MAAKDVVTNDLLTNDLLTKNLLTKNLLTKNFRYDEFFVSREFPGHIKRMRAGAPDSIKTTLFLLCHTILQPVRDFIETPMIITSGYRDEILNEKVSGSAKGSLHMLGIAADFTILRDKKKLSLVYGFILNELSERYGQLILYEDHKGNCINIHVSLPYIGRVKFNKIIVRPVPGR